MQCLNTVLAYPDTLSENVLFTTTKQLRDFSIILNNIRPSQIHQDAMITFGLLKEGERSEYMVAWKVPLANVLFGPPFQTLNCCGTTERNATYRISFRNQSQRILDYYLFIHTFRVTGLSDGRYSFLLVLMSIGASHL